MKQKFQTLKKAIDGKLHWIVGAVIVIQPALDVLSYFLGELGNNSFSTALRFLLQSNVVVIPKSMHKERMAQNIDVFDFALSDGDMAAIRGLDEGESAFFSHYDPETVEFLTGLGK